MIATDAASDELLSAAMLKSRQGLMNQDDLRALLPKLRFCLRDAAHASRRVISRTFGASKKMVNNANHFGRASWSLGQKLQHSAAHRRIFKKHVKRVVRAQRVRIHNLRCAKHRFESWSRPLARHCIWLGPLVETAIEIMHTKRGEDISLCMARWLRGLDAECCLVGAFMADGADGHLQFLRKRDKESFDIGLLNICCRLLLAKLNFLFCESRGALRAPGFSMLMVEWLEVTRVIPIDANTVHCFGKFDAKIIDK